MAERTEENAFDAARALLGRFKGDAYLAGWDVLDGVGRRTAAAGKRAAVVRGTFRGSDDYVRAIGESLAESGVDVVAEIRGARPNTPREDVHRIARDLDAARPDVVISFGGGSTIDATKAADVLRTAGGDLDALFGTGQVTAALDGAALTPHAAVQTVAGSAAHLTRYANVTDVAAGQKRLIVDDAVVPPMPVFDYAVTRSTPPDLTADGAMDGVSHMLEVLYGAAGEAHYDAAAEIVAAGLPLVLRYLPVAMRNPDDAEARRALGLATDLGGYAIMTGGTNGGHLTSFSLVDVLPHGRACGLLNPYYTVLFAPAVEEPLRLVGGIYRDAGLTDAPVERLEGRGLGLAVAEAMIAFARRVGLPTRLADVEGFSDAHVDRALEAARLPQLQMKLQNMPVPMSADTVDTTMRPVLEAARDGDMGRIAGVG